MKQTLFIPLTFVANPVTTARINVPFKVSNIHVKSAGYQAGTIGTQRYVTVISNLELNSPLAILNQDTTYSSSNMSDVELELKNPQIIQGDYTFSLYTMGGILASTSNSGSGTDTVGLIIEFNSE